MLDEINRITNNAAPEFIPIMPGSDKGFFVIVWNITPDMLKAKATIIANITLGNLNSNIAKF